jgi:hypothetical protein
MATAASAGAKAAGALADAAKMGDDIAKNIDTIKAFREGLDSGKVLDDLTDISRGFDSIDDETFEMALNNKQLISKLNKADPKDLKDALGGIQDTTRLQDIGKKLDPEKLKKLKELDPALGKKLDPGFIGKTRNAATKMFRNRTTLANLEESVENISKIKPQNPPNDFKAVQEGTEALNKTDGSVEEVSQSLAKRNVANSEDMRKGVKSVNKLLKEGTESSSSLRKGLAELGITPASAAIGAGVIVLLCMAYDTDNPFTAVDRALDDTGKVVKGFKEVADSAATAVKDAAEGGFDFISFVTKNSWISFACSILCAILVFALFMMGMLGSMGGNNRR